MKRSHHRRAPLAAGAAALGLGLAAIVAAGPSLAQPAEISGTVTFEGGQSLPEGVLDITLETRAGETLDTPGTHARLRVDGAARTVPFSLSPAATSAAETAVRVVARLERPDGWLIARGSADLGSEPTAEVILWTVMY